MITIEPLEIKPSGQQCGCIHQKWPKWQWSVVGTTSEAFNRWLHY